MRIEWDANKDDLNRKKHRVSFALASEIFLDGLIATVVDERHAADEMRFFSIGVTRKGGFFRLDIPTTARPCG